MQKISSDSPSRGPKEFIDQKSYILAKLDSGQPLRVIWKSLADQKLFTRSYRTFCSYTSRYQEAMKYAKTKENSQITVGVGSFETSKNKTAGDSKMSDPKKTPKKTVHLMAQGKGGVGKSVISSFITQYLLSKNHSVLPIDTDPVNATLTGYKAFETYRVDLLDKESGDINPRNFDEMIERIFETEVQDIVIDNGASSFVPLVNYLKSSCAISLLQDAGINVVIHTVITAGQAMLDTLTGLAMLADTFKSQDAKFIVWLNEFWGVIEDNGKTFLDMNVFKEYKDCIKSVISIPKLQANTFGEDLSKMLKAKLTFDQAISDSNFKIMEKQRIKTIKENMFANMSVALV